jgi:pimeloyl-ACP methyl ester carboxylesterase
MACTTKPWKPPEHQYSTVRTKAAIIMVSLTAAMAPTAVLAQTTQAKSGSLGNCGAELKTALADHADTQLVIAKPFKRGDRLVLTDDPSAASSASAVEGGGTAQPPIAGTDLCMVKLIVGPGNPGPAGAPSTSAGIGIEILLPSPQTWNQRIRVFGNSGWSGTPQASPTIVASDDIHSAAVTKGFVVATSDNGHVGSPVDASFAMNPDGSINNVGWRDFSERSLHELAEKTKAVTRAYYGRPHRFAYWDGFSTGGRQALKVAQRFPDDFDGILAGAPAINWSTFHTGNLYGQIAMKQELGRVIAPEKLAVVTKAAIQACGGSTLGFVLDPLACRYDPVEDSAVLCPHSTSAGDAAASQSTSCITREEAKVVNKLWYGQTRDGSAPSPAVDNGESIGLSDTKRLWFGWTRSVELKNTSAGGAPGLLLAADQVALEMKNPLLGSTGFRNATGNGENRWITELDYAGLVNARSQGLALQSQFSAINTDSSNLSAFAAAKGKLLMYHGLDDEYIPVQGSIHYYQKVVENMGGIKNAQRFYRFYLVPGFTHSGRSEGAPFIPIPQPASGRDEMFAALQTWVEHDQAPQDIKVQSGDARLKLPLCLFPKKLRYVGTGSEQSGSSYKCQ